MRKKISRAYAYTTTVISVSSFTTCLMWLYSKKDLLEILIVSGVLAILAVFALGAIYESIDEADEAQRAALKRAKLARENDGFYDRDEYEFFEIVGGVEIPVER